MAYELPYRIKNVTPYEPLQGEFKIRLDANESFIPTPDWLRQEIAQAVSSIDFHRYPDPYCTALCKVYGEFINVDPACIVAGNGSDELIGLIISSFVENRHKAVTMHPEFSMYSFYAKLYNVDLERFEKSIAKQPWTTRKDFQLSSEDALECIDRKRGELFIISNPCNPTGSVTKREEILEIVEEAKDCLIVVDEAYMDFSEESIVGDVMNHDNLLVLKTCSKAYGMAAIRLGFAIGNPTLINTLKAIKSPYNINALTQETGRILFSHPDYLRDCIRQIKESRDFLEKKLDKFSLSVREDMFVCRANANFVYAWFSDAPKVFQGLCDRGIAVRLFGEFLRITAGTPEENAALVSAVRDLLWD